MLARLETPPEIAEFKEYAATGMAPSSSVLLAQPLNVAAGLPVACVLTDRAQN
jgi:hypothetical protein